MVNQVEDGYIERRMENEDHRTSRRGYEPGITTDAIQADKEALALYSKNEAVIPLRINIDVPKEEGQSLYMPGYAPGASALGIKIISVYPKNLDRGLPSVPATMVLINEKTGEVCAIMDGTHLTRIRTGAVSGAATELLARKDAKIFALFGTGGQAESQLEAVLEVRDIQEVRIFGRNKERAQDFAQRMTEKFGENMGSDYWWLKAQRKPSIMRISLLQLPLQKSRSLMGD